MKLILVAGPAATGKTAVIKRIIEKMQKESVICYFKMDVNSANEDLILSQEYGIATLKYYSGELCPDHAEITVLPDAFKWAEECKADLLIIESAGLCLRCSPFLTQGVNIAVISLISGIHSIEKMKPLISLSDSVILTRMDLVSQAEREVFSEKLSSNHRGKVILETNALQGTSMDRIIEMVNKSPDIDYNDIQLKGYPPLGTCTVCIGKKDLGWANHFGVVRKITDGVIRTIYRGD